MKFNSLPECLESIRKSSKSHFNESFSIEFAIESKTSKNNQGNIRISTTLPNGIKRKIEVLFFGNDADCQLANDYGAKLCGGTELINKILQDNACPSCDMAIATQDIFSEIGKIAKILGPKGLMPNKKDNTIVKSDNIKSFLETIFEGKSISAKGDSTGRIRVKVGDFSMPNEKIVENIKYVFSTLVETKPSNVSVKNFFYNTVYIASTQCKGTFSLALKSIGA